MTKILAFLDRAGLYKRRKLDMKRKISSELISLKPQSPLGINAKSRILLLEFHIVIHAKVIFKHFDILVNLFMNKHIYIFVKFKLSLFIDLIIFTWEYIVCKLTLYHLIAISFEMRMETRMWIDCPIDNTFEHTSRIILSHNIRSTIYLELMVISRQSHSFHGSDNFQCNPFQSNNHYSLIKIWLSDGDNLILIWWCYLINK